VAGLEGLSRQLAGVMQFALQRRLQQEKQQQTLDAVRAEQAKEDERLDRKLQADFANLQTKMAQDAAQFREQQETERKKLGIMSREKEFQADIDQLRNLRALEKAESDLRIAKIQKGIGDSKEVRDLNYIQAARTLYPAEQFLETYEAIIKSPTNFPGTDAYIDPQPYLDQAEYLRRQRKAFLQAQGVTIPEEYGPFREEMGGYRTGAPLGNQPPVVSPFDFMGEGGREITETPGGQKPAKPKLEY